MKKSILLTLLCILIAQTTRAKLTVSKAGDGTVTLTLKAAGDLANEFTAITGQWLKFTASTEIKAIQNATKIKVVTAEGVTMSTEDLNRLCGADEGENEFPNVTTLDLEYAKVNDNELTKLSWMDNLKTITFPRTTTNIPASCLINNSCKIENVIIPDNSERSVTIGTQAFHTTSLKTVVLGQVDPNGTSSIGTEVFLNDTNLSSVDFHYGWTTIGTHAFYGCSSLKSIVLPEGVTTIKNGAFSSSAIEAIRLPGTLKTIESTAFNCSKLKSITIPASVTNIESESFQECQSLTDVYVLGTDTKIANGAFQSTNTYNYNYQSGSSDMRSNYTNKDSSYPVTILHYPEAAKSKYLNSDILNHNTQYQEYVQDQYGNYSPKEDHGHYTITSGDYAGWKNFMLTQKIRNDETWEDDKRTGDKWYTMCLPFDMTEEQLKSAYGATVEVVEFSGVTSGKENNEKYITLHFNTPVTETKAHHPYMIHPAIHAGNKTGIKNTIVGIEKKPENDTNLQSQKVTRTCDGITYTFIGNYAKDKRLQQYSYYYYSGDNETEWPNAFYKWTNATGSTWTPYFACVLTSADDGARAKAGTQYFTEAIDHTTTAIAVPSTAGNTMHATNGKVFSINGQLVRTGSTSLEGLPKGIYIVNGKKQMVR